MEKQSGLSELSAISWVSAVEGCLLSGVPLYCKSVQLTIIAGTYLGLNLGKFLGDRFKCVDPLGDVERCYVLGCEHWVRVLNHCLLK